MLLFWINLKNIVFVGVSFLQSTDWFDFIDTDSNDYLQLRDFGNVSAQQKERLEKLFTSIWVDISKLSSNTWYPKSLIADRITSSFMTKYNEITYSSSRERRQTLSRNNSKNTIESWVSFSWQIKYPPKTREQSITLQKMLWSEGYYTMKIDGNFWIWSRKALQKFLQAKWYYSAGIDWEIGNQSLKALDQYNARGFENTRTVIKNQNREIIQSTTGIDISRSRIRNAKTWINNKYSPQQINQIAWALNWKPQGIENVILAVASFQSKNGLFVDGKPWKNTLTKLGVNIRSESHSQSSTTSNSVKNSNRVISSGTESNTEGIRTENLKFMREYVPRSWHSRFAIFLQSLSSNERLSPSYPVIICDSSRRSALHILWNNTVETNAYFWGKWFQNYSVEESWLTPKRVVFHFNDAIIPANRNWNASYNNVDWVIGASLVSPEWRRGRWKWFHGLPWDSIWTNWCVWFKDLDLIRAMALQVKAAWKWYWYVV